MKEETRKNPVTLHRETARLLDSSGTIVEKANDYVRVSFAFLRLTRDQESIDSIVSSSTKEKKKKKKKSSSK